MLTVATLLKRLEALEREREGAPEIKVFIYYPEKDPPFWKPENPESWQQSHPKGRAILLSMRDCGSRQLEGSPAALLKEFEALEVMQAGNLTEDQSFNSNLERSSPENISYFEE